MNIPKLKKIYKKSSNQKKGFFFKTLFLFAIFIFFFGFNFIGFLSATLKNINSDYSTLSLYPQDFSLSEENPDFYQAWWNAENALDKPDLSNEDSLLYFSDSNSAFYSGGNYEITFDKFSLPREEAKNKDIPDQGVEIIDTLKEKQGSTTNETLEEESTNTKEENGVSKEASTTDENIIEETKSNQDINSEINEVSPETLEEPLFPKEGEVLGDYEENYNDVSNEAALIEEKDAQENESSVEILSDPKNIQDSQAVEIINTLDSIVAPASKEETKEEDTKEDTKEDTVDVSSLFVKEALAQTDNISPLNDFGKFKSAKINLSLAYASRSAFKEDREENFVEGNDSSNDSDLGNETPVHEEGASSSDQIILDENQENKENGDSIKGENEENPDPGMSFIDKLDNNISEDDAVREEESKKESEAESTSENILEEAEETKVEKPEALKEEGIGGEESIKKNEEEQAEKEVSLFNFIKKARAADNLEEKIIIWYSVEKGTPIATGTVAQNIKWHKLKTIKGENFSNALNGGYLQLEADLVKDWQDVENLSIKLEGLDTEDDFVFYLDSLWVDVDYIRAEDAPETDNEKMARWSESLKFISGKEVFDVDEDGELKFHYTKNSQRALESLGEFLGFIDYWKDVDLEVSLISASGIELPQKATIIFEGDGEFSVKLPEITTGFEPGKYKMVFNILDKSGEKEEKITLSHKFSWGVLAFNTDKSVYYPGEEAYLQMAVLDDYGLTLCDAELSLEIIDPVGRISELSTEDGSINLSQECGPKSVTNKPDYFAYYQLGEAGDYQVKINAKTKNGIREIENVVQVRKNQVLDVSRKSASRIYPLKNYSMEISIEARDDYLGYIEEYLPTGFKLLGQELKLLNSRERDPFSNDYKFEIIEDGDYKKLSWQGIDLRSGDKLLIRYIYDAPDISPEFYLLGPLKTNVFSESRKWQIASDATNKRAKTVMFLAGTYSGNGTTGQNSNTNNTFSTFNFKLAETGVEIKNAYVMFEAQYEAYSNSNIYSGYNLAFDSCAVSCTADAFSGTNRVLANDTSVLSYSETESNQVRLFQDVSAETQLAAYTGAGAELQAQVGYRLNRASAANSIATAKAVLYVTYLYDADSQNITNTVSYPLDSTNGTDSGSRQASIGACTRNSTCPTFDYKMDIPEWPGTATSSNRMSQWFRTYDANDSNNSNDINMDVNIQGYDVDSATVVHESQNSGTQGNTAASYFADWASSGYAENSNQQLETYFNTGNNYAVGGEVFETYIASSSASEKTRTVTFPLGVISNGNSTALASSSVDVYFPENGSTSGNVTVKSAYFRIITNNMNSANLNVQVSTKVGNNPTSGSLTYAYNGGGTVLKPSYSMIHIIPSADYSELGLANAINPKNVLINATQSNVNYGGISAELVITYTYTDESRGYLTNINLYGGQSNVNPTTSVNLSTANSVMPEPSGKTVYSAGLLASYLNSDVGGAVGAGTIFLQDANISTGTPSCVGAYRAIPDSINTFTEFYKNITSAFEATDNQSYTACYFDDESLDVDDGAKMGGQLIYTYGWENGPPTGSFNSLDYRTDDSGVVDISVELNDPDYHELRAKIDYETGTSCAFTVPLDPNLDESNQNITADYGDPGINNTNMYQVGINNAYVVTASGTNSVLFDWLAETDLGQVEGDYCLRLTANDSFVDQNNPATSTVYIDTLNPTAPGSLSLESRTGTSLTLNLGTSTTETNFREYKIFYKLFDGTDPDENDSVLSSSTDSNLANISFNGATTTTISSLVEKNTYSIAIWAYDNYGNRASSSRVDIYTNDAPVSTFNSAQQRIDGLGVVDISLEVDDANNDDTNVVRVDYVSGASCDFSTPLDPTLDETQSNIYVDFGLPSINNNNIYQIGTSGAYILTSPGSNTLEFDWFGQTDEPSADGTYCLRSIVNDSHDDQLLIATSTLTLDNVSPSSTGNLGIFEVGLNSITLLLATSSPATDTNEPVVDAYKIFYKNGTSGVTESDTEHDLSALNSYNYNGVSTTTVSGLNSDTDYVFNIWSYDSFGNKVSATEISAKTNSTIVNESLTFTNATGTNIALLDGVSEWNFSAVVSDTDGWYALNNVYLRLADDYDNVSPFNDLEFRWGQSLQNFSEIGTDNSGALTLSPNSTSTCALNTCTINFKLIFNQNFATSSVNYSAELYSTNDSAKETTTTYADIYQARYIKLEQIHYRWRNDDGGE